MASALLRRLKLFQQLAVRISWTSMRSAHVCLSLAYDDCKLIQLAVVLVNTASNKHAQTTTAHKPPQNAH
jgi:hypothetical protein